MKQNTRKHDLENEKTPCKKQIKGYKSNKEMIKTKKSGK
jgi:hypothetical protein